MWIFHKDSLLMLWVNWTGKSILIFPHVERRSWGRLFKKGKRPERGKETPSPFCPSPAPRGVPAILCRCGGSKQGRCKYAAKLSGFLLEFQKTYWTAVLRHNNSLLIILKTSIITLCNW
jgi:hypothetical protein